MQKMQIIRLSKDVLQIDNLISAMESGFGVGILISKAD